MHTRLVPKFAGPLAHCVLDLVCDACDALGRGAAILGVYRIPPRERGAAQGGSAAPGHALQARRRRAEVAPKPRRVPESNKRAPKNHDRIWIGFRTPKCSQKPPKMIPKTFKKALKLRCGFRSSF